MYTVSGLSQGDLVYPPGYVPPPTPPTSATDPLWARLVAAFGTPFAQAVSSRIAYGRGATPPVYYPPATFGGFGGISPTVIALGVGAVLLLVFMPRR